MLRNFTEKLSEKAVLLTHATDVFICFLQGVTLFFKLFGGDARKGVIHHFFLLDLAVVLVLSMGLIFE